MALLQPDSTQPTQAQTTGTALDNKQLVLGIQRELARVGCNPGRPDGSWGQKRRRALENFARHGKLRLANLDPSPDLMKSSSFNRPFSR